MAAAEPFHRPAFKDLTARSRIRAAAVAELAEHGYERTTSRVIAALFDQMVDMTEQWIAGADEKRADPPFADRRTRAAVFNAMVLGVPLLREHLSRVLGVDTFSPDGDRKVAMALLDIYSHTLI